jgi:predicted  nucleic acid-binding Zn-ribbon protein
LLKAELEDMKQQLSDATQALEEWKTRYEDNQDSYTDLQAELARVVDERDRAVEDLATRGGGEEESEKITQLTEELADIAAVSTIEHIVSGIWKLTSLLNLGQSVA